MPLIYCLFVCLSTYAFLDLFYCSCINSFIHKYFGVPLGASYSSILMLQFVESPGVHAGTLVRTRIHQARPQTVTLTLNNFRNSAKLFQISNWLMKP